MLGPWLRRIRFDALVMFLLVCIVALLSLATARLGAQEALHRFPPWMHPRYVMLGDSARAVLSADWERHGKDWPIVERAYCASYTPSVFAGEAAYLVTAIAPASVTNATQGSVTFSCVTGQAPVHTHPPQTCVTRIGPCERGHEYAYQCFPSDDDVAALTASGEPFGLVQCDRFAAVFFFPRQP